jgi:ApaG protein
MSDICQVTIDNLVELNPESIQAPYKYGYAYTISIHNISPFTVQIQSRKWIVKDGDMKDKIVEGEGVVGEFPVLESGEKFTYRSYHIMLSRYGSALGNYYGVYTSESEPETAERKDGVIFIQGEPFDVEIPEFQLIHRAD